MKNIHILKLKNEIYNLKILIRDKKVELSKMQTLLREYNKSAQTEKQKKNIRRAIETNQKRLKSRDLGEK